jgi:hypothetical protein
MSVRGAAVLLHPIRRRHCMAYIPATNAIRLNVSVGSDSDFDARNREVGFTPVNGRCQLGYLGPKSARSGSQLIY